MPTFGRKRSETWVRVGAPPLVGSWVLRTGVRRVELLDDVFRTSRIRVCLAALLIGATIAVTYPPVAGATPSSGGAERRAGEQMQLVRSLRRERAELRERLRAFSLRLDATRLRMSEMTFELGRARADYERTYAEFVAGLVAVYKQSDRFAVSEIVADLGFGEALPEYEFFSRLATDQQKAVDDLLAQQSRVEILQGEIADLKGLRLQEESSLRVRLEAVDEALRSGVSDLRDIREQLAETGPSLSASQQATTIPQPGIGGFFLGMSHPPADYRASGYRFAGLASWYGPGFQGNHTANGEIYTMYGFTCASRTLPFDTWLRLTYRGRAVFVRVNDRGPMSPDRVLDLSYAAATALGFSGVARIEAEIWAP